MKPLIGNPSLLVLLSLLLWACDGGGSVGPEEDPPRPCIFPDSRCRESVPVGGGFRLPVYRSLPLLEGDTVITRAVIVVHGTKRNADDYFETMVEATGLAGRLDETLVISPRFQTAADGPASNEPRWTSGGWKRGDQSNAGPSDPDGIGSYEAMDSVLALLGDRVRYPALEKVVVTGHSAGGQFVHRFAAGSRMEERLTHLRIRYLPANPSTWLFLGPEREGQGSGGEWGVPDTNLCPDYNDWHYGLEDVNPYIAAQPLSQIRSQLASRDVIYMLGNQDVGSSYLDMSCGAMLQGPNRYARGLSVFEFMETFYPEHEGHLSVVPGVAHSSFGIYTSPQGQIALFNW